MSDETPEERAEQCRSAWDEAGEAEQEWWTAEDAYQSALVDAIRASMSAITTCIAHGMDSEECLWKRFDFYDAEDRAREARDDADKQRREAEHENREFIECVSGHKFHGHVWLPLPD